MTAALLGLGVLLTIYLGTWLFRIPLGIIRPAANLAYFYYSDYELADSALYVLYWPCYKLLPGMRHNQDRPEFRLEDMGP